MLVLTNKFEKPNYEKIKDLTYDLPARRRECKYLDVHYRYLMAIEHSNAYQHHSESEKPALKTRACQNVTC